MNPDEILKTIQLLSSKASEIIERETTSFTTKLTEELKKLSQLAIDYKRQIEESKIEWKRVKDEVESLEERKNALVEREAKVDEKIKRVSEQEVDLVSLHDVLERKRKVLDAREQELDKKHQVIDERIKNYKVATPIKNP